MTITWRCQSEFRVHQRAARYPDRNIVLPGFPSLLPFHLQNMDRKEAWPQRSPATTFGEAVVRTAQAQGPDRDSLACMARKPSKKGAPRSTAEGCDGCEVLRSLLEKPSSNKTARC